MPDSTRIAEKYASLAVQTQTSRTRTEPAAKAAPPPLENKSAIKHKIRHSFFYAEDKITLSEDALREINQLQTRDREVRSHELAHASVGGQYAGTPSYTYTNGPDGRLYAIGGEVDIDTSTIPGDPGATLEKAEQIIASALAPANPSAADRNIAARAKQMATEARTQMMSELEGVTIANDEIGDRQKKNLVSAVTGIFPFSSPPPADALVTGAIDILA